MCFSDRPQQPSPVQPVSRLLALPAHTTVFKTYHVHVCIDQHLSASSRRDCCMCFPKHCWEVDRQTTSLAFATCRPTQADNICMHEQCYIICVSNHVEHLPSFLFLPEGFVLSSISANRLPGPPTTWPYQAYHHALHAGILCRWQLQSAPLIGLAEHGEVS